MRVSLVDNRLVAYIYIYQNSYNYSFSYVLVHSFPSWLVMGRNQCNVSVALPNQPIVMGLLK